MDHLSGISAFVAAAETSSFVEAGQQLSVSASAIGKSVARLESRFGVRLFHRNTRSMKLTAEGELLLQRCHRILGELKAAEQELDAVLTKPSGKLRVSVPLISSLILPYISRFIESHPQVDIEIDFTDRKVDLIEEGFDAVVRIGETTDTRLMSKSLGMFRQMLVASPAYLAMHGAPIVVDDLLTHRLLLYRFLNTGKIEPWPVAGLGDPPSRRNSPHFVCNSIETLKYLALEHHGIACLPEFEAREALADNRLTTLLEQATGQPRALTILWATSKQLSPKVRAFIDAFSTIPPNAFFRPAVVR